MTEIPTPSHDADEDRRKFLATCGKFAVVTPPAITMLLSTSLHSTAIAQSGGGGARFHRSNGVHKSNGWGGHKSGRGASWGGRKSWGGNKSS
jgi:hypothetical protein